MYNIYLYINYNMFQDDFLNQVETNYLDDNENDPNQIFENYDYTICMSYLDCKGKWKCHPDYFPDLNSRKVVRNKKCIENRSKIKKLHAITEIKRLLKIINKGFSIDSKNLKIFLEDNRDIILSEYEYIEKIKNSH